MEDLKRMIRDIPDFPKKGVIFKDITTLLSNAKAFATAIDLIGDRYIDKKVDLVVAAEARGFVFGAALAYKLNAGVILIRKTGKLPYRTVKTLYELEYGTDELEIHEDAISEGNRVLLVDDLLATGGTSAAAADLIQRLKGDIVGFAFLIELTFLKGRERLGDYDIFSLIQF
ncbi:MAG: adenine phosphoribosyltransferase [Candidatus Tectomicrobia bacterium]|nr:adenine phosphoribosyltransferase [Candidatus Tectomicrobia bacterium]